MIRILIEHSNSSDQELIRRGEKVTNGSKKLLEVYRILLKKFKKLKKTKEEMTKYCMRKAFKSISDRTKQVICKPRITDSPSKSPRSPNSMSTMVK